MRRAVLSAVPLIVVASLALVGCTTDVDQTPAEPTEEAAVVDPGTDPAMVALCDQMVADAMTVEEATALAEANGYIARVGSIDGEPQAVTMDYRLDRFTFDVVDGAVTACQYG